MIRCTLCDKGLAECQCPGMDRAAELRTMAYDQNSHIVFKWCRKCDNHYAICKCDPPEFYVISRGKDVTNQGFTNILGHKVEADLTKR